MSTGTQPNISAKKRKTDHSHDDKETQCLNPRCTALLKQGLDAMKLQEKRYATLKAVLNEMVDLAASMDPDEPEYDCASFGLLIELGKNLKDAGYGTQKDKDSDE